MRGHDPQKEAAVLDIFAPYLDLERNTNRKYTGGAYSLDRMAALADVAGNPQRRLRIVHVAGTKGKGSTCLFLTALLRAADLSVGTFLSPHLVTIRERFLLNGQLTPYETLLRHARRFEQAVRERGLNPTFFEMMTVIGLILFAEHGCEYAVLETGIGGLLDATNFIDAPACTAIAAVSLDHTLLLGNTIPEIARQKAGIIKEEIPVVCGAQPFPEAEQIIRAEAGRKRAPFRHAPAAVDAEKWGLSELADFQCENFATALGICEVLGIVPVPARFAVPALPGRMECIRRVPLVIIDAAHNADSARRLACALNRAFPGRRFTVVLGVTKGKDAEGILSRLVPVAGEFVLTHPLTDFKGSELVGLERIARRMSVPYRRQDTLRSADELPQGADLLFTGSFYTALLGKRLFDAAD